MMLTAAATTNGLTTPSMVASSTEEEEESSVIQGESNKNSNGHRRYHMTPLVVTLIVVTMAATLSLKNRPAEQITDWATDMHRRLFHPHDAPAYFACTRMLSTSDTDYDNSLTMDEFKGFTNLYADDKYGTTVGQNLPKDLREIFNQYAAETEGKSNQIIDIYGSRNGERDGITKHQEDLLEELCNATSNTLDKMFGIEHKYLGVTSNDVSTVSQKQVSCVDVVCYWTLPSKSNATRSCSDSLPLTPRLDVFVYTLPMTTYVLGLNASCSS
jgi:hypothetical protein